MTVQRHYSLQPYNMMRFWYGSSCPSVFFFLFFFYLFVCLFCFSWDPSQEYDCYLVLKTKVKGRVLAGWSRGSLTTLMSHTWRKTHRKGSVTGPGKPSCSGRGGRHLGTGEKHNPAVHHLVSCTHV